MKTREPREDVRITVRFVSDDGWADAEIRNVSPGGLMATSPSPPGYGSYVEIRREGYAIIGRVAWSSRDCFGVQVREKICLAELLNPHAPRAEGGERRQQPRPRDSAGPRATPGELAEASTRQARRIDFVLVTIGVATFAGVVAVLAGQAVSAQFGQVHEALAAASSG